MKRNKKILIIFIVAFFIIIQMPILLSADSWSYNQLKDEMSGEASKNASKQSENAISLKAPYSGPQHGRLLILDKRGPVLFYIEKGQIVSSGQLGAGRFLVRVKFDDKKDKYIEARMSGNDSTTIAFMEPGFSNELRKSKKLMIQVEIFRNGFNIFTFDTSGLNPSLEPAE